MSWLCTFKPLAVLGVLLFVFAAQMAFAATEDLGKGFRHHGVATPVSNHRGIVATVDGQGRDVVLVWLYDHRGGYALLLIDAETGSASVYRDMNGKVYGCSGADNWYELYRGEAQKVGKPEHINTKPIITSSQSLFYQEFPDGKKLKACDLVDRVLVVEDPKTGDVKKLKFDYTSEGAHIMGLAAAPDGAICGGAAFPMRFFSFNRYHNAGRITCSHRSRRGHLGRPHLLRQRVACVQLHGSRVTAIGQERAVEEPNVFSHEGG